MLFISRTADVPCSALRLRMFQSRNRDAFHFKCGAIGLDTHRWSAVSISESRCFSFQVCGGSGLVCDSSSFNLGIEMLFISSRTCNSYLHSPHTGFNLGIEMLFISSNERLRWRYVCSAKFQSRNRDAFRFKNQGYLKHESYTVPVSISESRCFSFQVRLCVVSRGPIISFNLGIEMLFVSSAISRAFIPSISQFQSRNRDAFRFKDNNNNLFRIESPFEFQSRNRDAFRFKRRGRTPATP